MLTMNITLALFFVVVFLGITSAIEVEEDGGHHDGDGLTSITVNSAVLTQHSTFLNPVPADHLQDPLPSSISLKTDLGKAPARVLCCGYPLWGDSLGNPW